MKILFLDIETSPIISYHWSLKTEYIQPEMIIEPSRMLCFAAKFRDSPLVFKSEFHHSREDMITTAYQMMTEADVIVTYNGPRFDIKVLNREIDSFGLTPPAPSKQIDLLSVVKKAFYLPSYKLSYVSEHLGIGQKVQHSGMQMWKDCLRGDKKAWSLMRKYCIGDVSPLLEDLYDRLLPWISNHPNRALYGDDGGCPTCSEPSLMPRGYTYTSTGKYRRYRCDSCGSWSQSGRRVEGVEVRAS